MKYIYKLLPDSFYIQPKHLSVYRIVYCSAIMLFVGLPSFYWLGNSIDYLFNPPSISLANLFDGFPGGLFFSALTLINLVAFFFMFWGMYCKGASVVYVVSSVIGHNFIYSFGKIEHGMLLLLTPLLLAFAGWGDYYSFDAYRRSKPTQPVRKQRHETVSLLISLLAIAIGFSMFTAGLFKITGGWLSWSAEAVRGHMLNNYYALGRDKFLAGYLLQSDSHIFWKLMDYSTLVFEIGMLLSVIRRRLFDLFVVAAVIFHLFVYLTFNISFHANLIVFALFLDWSAIENKIKASTRASRIFIENKGRMLLVLFALSAITAVYWLIHLQDASFMKFPSVVTWLLRNTTNIAHPESSSTSIVLVLAAVLLLYSMLIFAGRWDKRNRSYRTVNGSAPV